MENNKLQNEEINKFFIMLIGQFSKTFGLSFVDTYLLFSEKEMFLMIQDDYEDLHGMSFEWLVDFCQGVLKQNGIEIKHKEEQIQHTLAKSIIITRVIEMIASNQHIRIDEARTLFFKSKTIKLLEVDETGLYVDSPLYVYSLFEEETKKD